MMMGTEMVVETSV